MKHPVRLECHSGVAVISIDNPPVNALGAAVRRGILAALDAAVADPEIESIVLAANGRTFPAGADIKEFGAPPVSPSLPDLCDRIEASPKPVIAALHGHVLGGGLELAMAAHYRIAQTGTKLGLPEINLGILPGAGGTQRTPRLIGVDAALDLMLTGAPIDAIKAYEQGLIDGVVEDQLRETARSLAAETTKTRRTRDKRTHLEDGAAYMARIAARRAEATQAYGKALAPQKIIDCVEAALLLPFDAGRAVEGSAFEDCVSSRDSIGLRHAFFAERAAPKFPELAEANPAPIERVGILGGGGTGNGNAIAIACLNAGLKVTLVELGEAGVTAALDRIGAYYQSSVDAGRMSQGAGASALTHLTLTEDPKALAEADLVIETLPEDFGAKKAALADLAALVKHDAVLASNTSYLNLNELAQASGRAADVVGLHFFAPAHHMKLVEIGVGAASSPKAVATAHGLIRRLGKTPVRSGGGNSYIGNRLLMIYRDVADRMLLDGATPHQIDAAMRSFGFPVGPYQALDLTGLDMAAARRAAHVAESAPDARYVELGDRMYEAGWLGEKADRGYYLYHTNEDGTPNPDVATMLVEERRAKGITTRKFTAREIRDRILLAIVNEGATLLEEGVASRPSDIDTVMLLGFGYPRARGGPMLDADMTTLFTVKSRIENLAKEDPTLWQVPPTLKKLANERQRFSDLNET